MRLRTTALTIICLLLLAALAPAQQPAQPKQGNLAEIHVNKVKPGMTQQYEAGRKKHMAWHRSQNDAWSWYTWEILTGEHNGDYVIGTFSHDWADLDGRTKFQASDTADAQASMGATLAGEVQTYYVYRPDLSMSPQAAEPAPMISIMHFALKPEGLNDFTESVKKVNEGIKKTNFPQSGASRWYQLVNGGQSPHFVLVGDRANWAAFQPATDKTLDAAMEEAYGKGDTTMATLRKAVRSVYIEALKYRPDLSYVAPSK